MIDVDAVRADTVGVDDVAHFNNAGSSPPPGQVVDAQVAYLRAEQRMGGYEAQDAHADQLDSFYTTSAELLGCSPREVAFTSSASDGWWRAFSSLPLVPGDRVLAGRSEFQTNAFGLLQARDRGVIVDVVPNDEHGLIDLDELDRLLDDRVRLVSLTQISMSNGAVQPAAEVGRRCRDTDVIFLLDACQAAGQLPLDVDELGCDFLVYTGRKFMRGPRGTGVLYANSGVLERLGPTPFVDGRSAEWTGADSWEFHDGAVRFELGEQNYSGKIGLGVATRYAIDLGIDAIAARVGSLAAMLRAELAQLPGVDVRDEGLQRSGIVTFTVDGVDAATVGRRLSTDGVNVSAPGRRNAQWDLGERGIEAVVRAGVHYFNTVDELDRLVAATARV